MPQHWPIEIQDPSPPTIEANVSRGSVKTNVSLSWGPIVTELVINALEHAYPGNRGGKISIGDQAEGDAWTLTVSDDGLGMQVEPTEAKAGLGSSIVTALVAQLGATLLGSAQDPGTMVSVSYKRSDSDAARAVLSAVWKMDAQQRSDWFSSVDTAVMI